METLSIRAGRPFVTAGREFLRALREDFALYRRYKKTLRELKPLTADELYDLHPVFRSPEDIAYITVYGRRRSPNPVLRIVK